LSHFPKIGGHYFSHLPNKVISTPKTRGPFTPYSIGYACSSSGFTKMGVFERKASTAASLDGRQPPGTVSLYPFQHVSGKADHEDIERTGHGDGTEVLHD
jgi:hypothetical protein